MSLEQTQQVKQEGKLGFDKINTETVTVKPATVQTTSHGQGNRSDRDLVSVTTPNITRETLSSSKKSGGPSSKSVKIQRANLGFQISFSIRLTGIKPTPPNNTSC